MENKEPHSKTDLDMYCPDAKECEFVILYSLFLKKKRISLNIHGPRKTNHNVCFNSVTFPSGVTHGLKFVRVSPDKERYLKERLLWMSLIDGLFFSLLYCILKG